MESTLIVLWRVESSSCTRLLLRPAFFKARPRPRLNPRDSILAHHGAPWDFRYGRMRNADLPSAGTSKRDAHERCYSSDVLVDALARIPRGYKCTPSGRRSRSGLQVAIQCSFRARERSFCGRNEGGRGKKTRKGRTRTNAGRSRERKEKKKKQLAGRERQRLYIRHRGGNERKSEKNEGEGGKRGCAAGEREGETRRRKGARRTSRT